MFGTQRALLSPPTVRVRMSEDTGLFWLMSFIVTQALESNKALWEAKIGASLELRRLRPVWATQQNPITTKNRKISQVWWHAPIVPTTQEAKKAVKFDSRERSKMAD
ncbi:putative uncharacterized protein C8orf44 [Plecturocebus cupreus]